MAAYKTALICRNGHVVTSNIESGLGGKRCTVCGAENIVACPTCNTPIRGYVYYPHVIGGPPYQRPSYCHNCGSAYPWTETKLQALRALVQEMENLPPDERKRLSDSLGDLIADTPSTETAAFRMKKALADARPAIASTIKNLLIDVATSAVKKQIGL